MSILGGSTDRRRSGASAPEVTPYASASPPGDASAGGSTGAAYPRPAPTRPTPEDEGRSELRRRRDALSEQVTELHWDLGGLAYEMAIRDHFRLDVLMRRAAVLQERDAELAEVERLLRLEESASAGSCPHCGAPHSRGALYCWQCGATLMERAQTATPTPSAGEGPTAVMDALIAPVASAMDRASTQLTAGDPEADGALGAERPSP